MSVEQLCIFASSVYGTKAACFSCAKCFHLHILCKLLQGLNQQLKMKLWDRAAWRLLQLHEKLPHAFVCISQKRTKFQCRESDLEMSWCVEACSCCTAAFVDTPWEVARPARYLHVQPGQTKERSPTPEMPCLGCRHCSC